MLDLRIPGAICEHCSLCAQDGHHPGNPVPGNGPEEAWLVIVGEAPAYSEVRDGKPFTGASGRMLWDELAKYDIARAECYTTNALLCPQPVGKVVKARDLNACSGRLEQEIKSVEGRTVILALGATAAAAIRGVKTRLGDVSGRIEWSERYNCHVVYAYHPAAILRNPDLYQEFTHAIQQIGEALETPPGPLAVEEIEWGVETSVAGLIHALEQVKERKLDRFVVDIETTGLDPWRDRILSIGFAWSRTEAYIVPEGVCYNPMGKAALKDFLEGATGRAIYHNGKFDVEVIEAQLGIYAYVGGDTMLLHFCLDERSGEEGGFHDLKRLSHKYCGAPAYAEGIDGSNMESVPPQDLWRYQAHDLVYTYRLWDELVRVERLEPPSRKGYPRPMRVHEALLMPASEALRRLEMRGIRIDKSRLAELDVSYEQQYDDARQRLEDMVRRDTDLLAVNFNPGSPVQVKQALVALGYKNVLSTAEAALHDLQREDAAQGRESHPFLDLVLDARSLKHTRSTYIKGIQTRLLRGPEGNDRLRSSFRLHGTTTGRLASRDPNLQNIPKGSVIRSAFIPADGYTFVEADYRRLEVGVLAWYSRDAKLMDDFLADDFHWSVALKIFPGTTQAMLAATTVAELEAICRSNASLHEFARKQERPLERTESYAELFGLMKTRLRRQSKYTSFGIMYGEGALALSLPEKGLGVPVEVAQEYIDNWKATYAVAMRHLNGEVRYAKDERWVESASGRRRRFSYPQTIATHIANEAMNHSIQAFASDINLTSLIRLDEQLPRMGLGWPLLPIHDSLLFEIRTDRLEEGKEVIHEVMTNVVVDDDMVFEIDFAVGPNWDQCH